MGKLSTSNNGVDDGGLDFDKDHFSYLHTYYLSLFPIPTGVAHCIEKSSRDVCEPLQISPG